MVQDIRNGKPTSVLITFAIPIILGNLFQQLYNTVDSMVLGHFQGELSLAAVGVSNPIMSIAIFLIFGICVGISVLLAQLYGAEEYETFENQVSTALLLGLGFTVLLSLFFFFASKKILVLTQTPPEIIPMATRYLKIISGGLIFTFFYNFYSSALRATGDSQTPFFFLFLSSVVNILLDLLFVVVLQYGIEGAAIATVIAQGISSLLCLVYINRSHPLLAFHRTKMVIHRHLIKTTISYSWITAMQQSFLYLGKLLIQSVINSFGSSSIAAFNAAIRMEALAYAPVDGLGNSASTFFAQNMGAHQPKRIQKGLMICMNMALGYSLCMALVLFFIPEQIMGLFVDSTEQQVITVGTLYLRSMSFFYLLGGGMYILQGFFRGIKRLKISFFATFTQILIRLVLANFLAPTFGILGISYATIAGWIWMFLFEGTLAIFFFRKHPVTKKRG